MAFSEQLAERLRASFADRATAERIEEKKMFGGLAVMVNGHMCCGVVGEELMVRVGPDAYADALAEPGAREMDFTGRPLKGMVYVGADAIAERDRLAAWVDRGLAFVTSLPPK